VIVAKSVNVSASVLVSSQLTINGSVINIGGNLSVATGQTLVLNNIVPSLVQRTLLSHFDMMRSKVRFQMLMLVESFILPLSSSLVVTTESTSSTSSDQVPLIKVQGCVDLSGNITIDDTYVGPAVSGRSVSLVEASRACNSSSTANTVVRSGNPCAIPTNAKLQTKQSVYVVTFDLTESTSPFCTSNSALFAVPTPLIVLVASAMMMMMMISA